MPALIAAVVAACAVANAQAPTPASAAADPRITGHVRFDDGRPPSDALVSLVPLAGGAVEQAVPGADGAFRFSGLEAGALYRLSCGSVGYVEAAGAGDPRTLRAGDDVNVTLTKGGAVTGVVTDVDAAPVVGIGVRVARVRDAEGRPFSVAQVRDGTTTDDRGVYRIFGLDSGSYVVWAQGDDGAPALAGKAPTYYPSATRAGAEEVSIRAGDEADHIDIRFRGERAFAVRGRVTGVPSLDQGGTNVALWRLADGSPVDRTFLRGGATDFEFHGVPDGEYELSAGFVGSPPAVADRKRVTIRGADPAAVVLELRAVGSLSGSVSVDATPGDGDAACAALGARTASDATVRVCLDDGGSSGSRHRVYARDVAPSRSGEFRVPLPPGTYRVSAVPPGDGVFVRAITMRATPGRAGAAGSKEQLPRDVASNGVVIAPGAKVDGIAVALARGAASVKGRVVVPANLRVGRLRAYLVPAEPDAADAALRFLESPFDGLAFAFANVPPGSYRVLVRPAPDDDAPDAPPRPIAWDKAARDRARAEALSQKLPIVELAPCQRVADLAVSYPPRTP